MKTYLPLFATIFLLLGCTLSMDEWAVPEEELGHDAPHTVENEYGTITYQFRDSVVFFTENLQQQYLVRTEADTILYISGSIPDEWRPYVGQKLATGISHELPYGLNNRVVSVQDQGGIYRVVTTRVPIEEVYKELNYSLDAGVATPDLSGLSEEELADLGYEMTIDPETGDTMLHDWNDYDIAHGLRPAEARHTSLARVLEARRTRAEGDETPQDGDKEQDGDKPSDGSVDGHKDDGLEEREGNMQEWEKEEVFKAGWDSRKDVGDGRITVGSGKGGEIFSKILETVVAGVLATNDIPVGGEEKRKLYSAGTFSFTRYQKVHALRDEKKKIEEEWTDSYSELALAMEVGLHKPGSPTSNEIGKNLKSVIENSKTASEWYKNGPKGISGSEPWEKLKVRVIFTVTPIPIAIVAGGSIEPIVDFSGFASISGHYTSDVVRSGCITKKGKQEPISNKVVKYDDVKPGFHFDGFCLNGSMKVGVSARVYAGVEFAGTASVTVGVNTEAAFEGNCSFNLSSAIYDAVTGKQGAFYENIKGSLGFSWKIFGDVTFEVAPLGMSVWKDSFNFAEKILKEVTYTAGPNLDTVNGYLQIEEDGDMIFGSYKTDNLDGFFPWTLLHTYYAGMKVYFGPIADNKWEYMRYEDIKGKPIADMRNYKELDDDQTYYFGWHGSLAEKAKEIGKEINEAHIVPVIYYLHGVNFQYSGPVNFENLVKNHITTDEAIEKKELEVKVEAGEPEITTRMASQIYAREAGPGRREIKFYSLVDVHTAGVIKDWGVKLYLYDHNREIIKTPSGAKARVIRAQNARRSGAYYFTFTFETDWSEYVSYADKNGNPITGRDLKMYFRIIPFWNTTASSAEKMVYVNATDYESKHYHELVYEKDDTDGKVESYIQKNSKRYGWTVTDTDLN